ncbi:MAG TPA: hypothetical protein VFQ61_35405, partial [Polyangiaceae bacterium]|nr:hypothetical protein [Polyangiaceae bacterium]
CGQNRHGPCQQQASAGGILIQSWLRHFSYDEAQLRDDTSMANVLVLGAGMMGSAFCFPLCDRRHSVRLVGTHLDAEIVHSIRSSGVHPKLNVKLPGELRAFPIEELETALHDVDAIVLGVSSAGVHWAAQQLSPHLCRTDTPVAMISKGLAFDGEQLITLPDAFARALPPPAAARVQPVGVAGPCIAGELARRVPTCAVFVSRSADSRRTFADLCEAPYYKVFTRPDVVGVEACAALKNAYAMGVALGTGIHLANGGEPGSVAFHNYESAVFAQAIWEMQRVIRHMGGDPAQASWLPGVGDLDVTCNGGRTGRFGQLLGTGLGPREAQDRMSGATLECLEILAVLRIALAHFRSRSTTPGEFVGDAERVSGGAIEALPLLEHLAEIALDGKQVHMPFESFFGGSDRL